MNIYLQWICGLEYKERILLFLLRVDDLLIPKLSNRVDVFRYADKLAMYADTVFVVYEDQDIASCSVYCNQDQAFISSIAVAEAFQHNHYGTLLMQEVKRHCIGKGCKKIILEVDSSNIIALQFYASCDFIICGKKDQWFIMENQIVV